MANVFTIPPGQSFVDALAAGLLAEAGDDPLALADGLVLLPTRRAARALREAFLRRSEGRALLLPRIQPLGDVDADDLLLDGALELELPPAVPPLRRQLLLARLVGRVAQDGRRPRLDHAVRVAAELTAFLDEVQTEGVALDALDGIVPDDLALHFQVTLDFLRILRDAWPAVLAEEGALDPVPRRDEVLRTLARRWRARPPDGWVLAAGSTGSVPAARELLQVIAGLPRGRVVVAGLDRHMDDPSWDQLDAGHPQWALKRLVQALGLGRADVRPWPAEDVPGSPPARAGFLREVMRPAATTEAWQEIAPPGPDALGGLGVEVAPDLATEALTLACRLRAALEVPGRTAALVTPDRNLARRVAVELGRWGVEVDDSAGRPLDQTPPGGFLLLTAHLIVEGVRPVTLLAALKHPLARGRMEQGRFRRLVRALELAVLRGPRIEGGFVELCRHLERYAERALEEKAPVAARIGDLRELCDWFNGVARLAGPFETLCGPPEPERAAPLPELLAAHIAFAEALAADEAGSPAGLWAREAGEAAAAFIAELAEAGFDLDPVAVGAYPALLAVLMAARPVRPRYNRHPRLQILGPLESRLQHADLMLLGGLNEETWPSEVDCGPWLSRPMRGQLGLPPVEHWIGLSAHDFVQAACAPEVVLSRAEKDEAGKPTVPSRWLVRLQAVLEATAGEGARLLPDGLWSSCAGRLDRPDGPPCPVSAPAPRPPAEVRPRRLSVAEIELWMRDPYGVYARHILRLMPLDPLDAEPGHPERGQVIHRSLEAFVGACCSGPLPPDARERLMACGEEAFREYANRPQVMAFWWPRFRQIAEWFLEQERSRRDRIERIVIKARGELRLGDFTLTARADRLERHADGGIAVIDYKSGRLPSGPQVEAGFSPQLPLLAALVQAGGFPDLPPAVLRELRYWSLHGGETSGYARDAVPTGRGGGALSIEELAARALEGLRRLVEHFDDPSTPYHARPRPKFLPGYSDYDHLARVKEWAVEDEA